MRVLILSSQSLATGVLRSMVVHGVDAVIVTHERPDQTAASVQQVFVSARGARDHPLDLRWSRRGLRTAVRDVRPELLHVVGDPWTPTAEAGAAAARDLDLPYVLVSTSSRGEPHSLTGRWQADRVRRGAAALAGTTRPALDHLTRPTAPDLRPRAVLPEGGLTIPARVPDRERRNLVTFGLVGRLVPERGVDTLLEALGTTQGAWRLVIAGTGPAHEALERQTQRLGLSSRVHWMGVIPREQLPEIWSQIDVLVAPSRSTPDWVEPNGHAVLEAMAAGVAPVVSRSGALPDIVGEAGLVVDAEDVDALARALDGLVQDPERCAEIGAMARQRVLECYSDAAAAARMVDLWRRVLDVRPPSPPE